MADKERRINDRSLENLKLGAQARYQGKIRQNFTVLPETLEWLKKGGNASARIDQLVEAAKSGNLKSNNTHNGKDEEEINSNCVYKEIEALKAELERLHSERDQLDREVNELHAKVGDLDLELANLKEQPHHQLPDLESIRDRVLSRWKVQKRAESRDRIREALDRFIAELQTGC